MEDHSMNSMIRTTSIHELPEESSWTMYLEDFPLSSNYADDDDGSSFSSSGQENCSVISDAGSSATRKLSGVNNGEGLRFAIDGSCKPKFVIKRGTRQGLLDDELEDTAISPVSSPKVCHLIQSDKMKPTTQTVNTGISNAGKGSTSGGRAERSQLGFNIGPQGDCTELKKRGLCLVPFSVAANYFG